VTRSARFKANTSVKAKDFTLTLKVLGKHPATDRLKVVEAGAPVPTTTTSTTIPAVLPTTTTSTTIPAVLPTTTSLGILSGSVADGFVFGATVTDKNGPVDLPAGSVVFKLVTNDKDDDVTWGWNATTLSTGQSSCDLLITASDNLTLTSTDCSVAEFPGGDIFATAVTVQASFTGTSTDAPSTSFEVNYP
jgi:hypothetical protein